MLPFLIGALVGAAVIVILVLKWDDIVAWFEDFFDSPKYIENLSEDEKDVVACVIDEGLKDGKHSTVKCGFNKRKKKLIDGERVLSKKIDDDVKEKFGGEKIIVLE